MKKKVSEEHIDGVYGDYSGKKRFVVSHPKFRKSFRIAAPNADAAIVAFANCIGEKWTKYEFYAFCEVFPA